MTCPDCQHKTMILKTKDADSKYMGWVKCSQDNCAYGDAFENFRAAFAAAKRANG